VWFGGAGARPAEFRAFARLRSGGGDGGWLLAFEADELTRAVENNLANLRLETLDVVNLRLMFDVHAPAEGSLAAPLKAVADLQR
jgi:pyridoxine 4-dehydrogenase